MVALRDPKGAIKNISRRSAAHDLHPPLPKSMQLSNRDSGGIWVCFGQLPAIKRSSRVILVEGAPDYLAASMIFKSHVVIGAISASHQIAVAKEIRRLSPSKITIIPHIGDSSGVGER